MALLVLIFLSSVAMINVLLDPYDRFETGILPEYGRQAPRRNVRMVSTYQVEHSGANSILIGSSRVAMGFDPSAHPMGLSWFNLAQPGISLEETIAYIEHALHALPLETVLIGLDMYMFDTDTRIYRKDFDPHRLRGAPPLRFLAARFSDLVNMTLSWQALEESLAVLEKGERTPAYDRGFWRDDFVALQAKSRRDYLASFEKNRLTHTRAIGDIQPCQGDLCPRFAEFLTLVERLHRANIDARFFFHPNHTVLLDGLDAAARERLAMIKSKVVAIITEVAARFGHNPYPVWDFFRPGAVTSVSVSEANWRLLREYYYEPGHYTPVVGTMVVCRMLEVRSCEIPPDFGVRLR